MRKAVVHGPSAGVHQGLGVGHGVVGLEHQHRAGRHRPGRRMKRSVVAFGLADPVVGPGRRSDSLLDELGQDLVGLEGVVKGGDLEAELVAQADHHLHVVHLA